MSAATRRRSLASGAVVVARRNVMTPAVTFLFSFDAGSAFDPPGAPGLAALTARMIDRGTADESAAQLAEEIERRGASIEISSNRQTVMFTATCLVEDFDDMLALAARMARMPAFPDDQLELRRRETLTRLVQDAENTAARAGARFFERLYGAGHPYAHPPRGTVESIERMTRGDLQDFHQARMCPGRLAVAVVGDIEEDAACDRVERALGGWDAAPVQAAEALPRPAPPLSRDFSAIEVPGKAQTDIAYGFLGPGRLDPEYYAFWIMNTVLGQYGMGGRLGENIRERQGMAYYASSSYDAHRIPGPLLVRAGVDPANVERTVAAIDFEVTRIAREGITEDEHANAIRYLAGSVPRMLETNAGVAQFLISVEQFGLGDGFDRRLPALLSSVTREEASASAAALDPARAVIAVAGP